WHQYRPLLTFAGADSTHLVSLLERSLCGQQVLGTPRAAKWNDWADDASTLSVSPTTSGTPARKTFDTTSWTVTDSFTATVKYRAYFTIAGKITTKDDTPVAGVQVKVGALEFITTDDGLFRFEDLDAGSYTIIPSKVGAAFAPSQLTVTVDGRHGDSLSNDFVLTTVPSVLTWLPLGGAVAPTAPVTILFSEPMNPASVARAFTLQETFPGSTSVGPIVTGTSVWTDDNRKLIFTPSARLKAYRNYRVTVGALAESAAGGPLGTDFQWTFQTKDCLAVVAYSPMAGSNPSCNAPIVIDFDRDVALATARACFSIAPQVEGRLSLLTPRKLQFQPSDPLADASTFKVTLTADMRGLDQVRLLKPFSWSFTTEGPAQVLGATPVGTSVPLSGAVVVTFDRPMKREVTGEAFSLTALGANEAVLGAVRWNAASTILTFVPAQWLRGSTEYVMRVAGAATSAQGAPLAADFQSSFTTANTLRVQSATPSGAGLAVNSVLRIAFDRPVNASTFALTVLPAGDGATPVDGTANWTDSRNVTFTPRYALAPATLYTATIANTLTAGDGTTLGMPYAWHFTTHGLTRVLAYGPRGAGLKPGAAITIRFDRPMDQLSVAANLQVFQIGDTAVPLAGQITWDASANQLTFTPATRLASFTDYRVTLSRNALSADNLALASSLDWMFQTAHAVQVLSFAPTGNLAATDAVVTLQFDQQMRRSTVQ
ncbi:MAG: Ig-like domain-containing protein, partial [Armatimonadota bacterium]